MQDTGWDRALRVTGDGQGLGGHAGAVLLRTLAAQAGLTAALGAALRGPESPRWRPGHRAGVHCALGAASMTGIALLGPPCPVLGAEPSDTTVRTTLELADMPTEPIAELNVQG